MYTLYPKPAVNGIMSAIGVPAPDLSYLDDCPVPNAMVPMEVPAYHFKCR